MKAWFEQELQLSYGNLLRLAKLMLANNQVNSKTGTYPAAKLEFYFENKRLPAPYFPWLLHLTERTWGTKSCATTRNWMVSD